MTTKPEISVIMTFCGEWPQIVFTLRSIHEDLAGIPHEVICVDNWCAEVEAQGAKPDRGHRHTELKKYKTGVIEEKEIEVLGHIEAQSKGSSWLKYVAYNEKLSHWNAKRVGIAASSAPILFFADAHVVPSHGAISGALRYYQREAPHGSLHLPLSYHIIDDHRLIYKLVDEREHGVAHYSFTSFPPDKTEVFEVPCMSTCGMMVFRSIYEDLGGWPSALGIYGGGEHFFNFTLAVLGYKKWIYPYSILHHHGDKRTYHYRYDDYIRNRMIATYLFGGKDWVLTYANHCRGDQEQIWRICREVMETCAIARQEIARKQIIDIDAWLDTWK